MSRRSTISSTFHVADFVVPVTAVNNINILYIRMITYKSHTASRSWYHVSWWHIDVNCNAVLYLHSYNSDTECVFSQMIINAPSIPRVPLLIETRLVVVTYIALQSLPQMHRHFSSSDQRRIYEERLPTLNLVCKHRLTSTLLCTCTLHTHPHNYTYIMWAGIYIYIRAWLCVYACTY